MVSISDIISYKRLVTAGNDQIWWEDINVAAGTMRELAAATDDIDTSDQLVAFESYQKVFVFNGANLKIADFINVKLTHTTLATPHAKGDILTQSNGTTATMVVDYTNATKTATYGYVMSGTFNVVDAITSSGDGTGFTPTGINGELTHAVLTTAHAAGNTLTQATTGATMVVEATDAEKTHTHGRITGGIFNTTKEVTGDGSGTAFTPTATNTKPPLWSDYVVHPGGSSGALPAKAYLGCAWRGKIVLSGNPNAPNQWYMSRQGDPFDYAYVANDAGSPVAGGENPDVPGQVGDIIRALIPFGKDYLLVGCATTIWAFSGDPAEGGSLNAIDETVGIFGANSWCLDGEDNLYFWGTGGIYMMQAGLTVVNNLTRISLPDLIGDEAADPSTHRITMAYDRKRYGIVICVTKLSDGTNSNYFYSLNPVTKGFYPESYPEECGAYSLFYYDANSTGYRDLLVGCKDGYIRKFNPTAKSDDIGVTTEAISSHVTLGPLKLADENREAYKVFVGRTAGTVAEKMVANTSPKVSGTFQATGRPRGQTKKQKARGVFAAIRLENTTADQTMSFDRLVVKTVRKGRVK